MVYYGALSKGCQRCRQRKIKCDQRRPGCLKCEKAKTPCPGFRNLNDVMFRDESLRIIKRVRKTYDDNAPLEQRAPLIVHNAVPTVQLQSNGSDGATTADSPRVPRVLPLPIIEMAANFFFAKYTCDEPPLSSDFFSWLAKMYNQNQPNYAFRAVIEATGMAGISNVNYAPEIASKAKERYVEALAATKQALNNPHESVSDATLVTVINLGIFEFITFEDWDLYHSWSAHLDGATALLQLRGQEQFNHERGEQLFAQFRSQLLYACLQQDLAPPQALRELHQDFRGSIRGKPRMTVKPGQMIDISYRLLDLRAAIKNGDMTDHDAILDVAIQMDNDLKSWRASLPPVWAYATVDAHDIPAGSYFGGKQHVYSSPYIAQVWNNWRTQRILVNRIIFDHQPPYDTASRSQEYFLLSLIQELSVEICISAPNFLGKPRSTTLIWPLLVVAQEPLNLYNERSWATEVLRHIGSVMGVRRASLLADDISRTIIRPKYHTVHNFRNL
ncbi:hypothetical protein P152DRAFT_102382 [Eremomyces bilateralis CBS 781.70]|uniref:Zn(2)-C6 fungal-type domain-containing protein n=1 Tax=Eremomyces bilateralis CBS 781.70 TaxID=1392243 RepID=A0A6G1FWI2_9PEZI|nr:uncharacterized protein P152DRAFT_102382 [Eremomyces bilateralis CBS 781.70]KAF1810197.1 hypothetical protein P152DRAFT_102382 [Eremomyces bilateralis CBS 781.70]